MIFGCLDLAVWARTAGKVGLPLFSGNTNRSLISLKSRGPMCWDPVLQSVGNYLERRKVPQVKTRVSYLRRRSA
jgi:hypothetical protein